MIFDVVFVNRDYVEVIICIIIILSLNKMFGFSCWNERKRIYNRVIVIIMDVILVVLS